MKYFYRLFSPVFLLLFALFLFIIPINRTQCQSDWCGAPDQYISEQEPPLDCNKAVTSKCVRIKFHFINNTNGPFENVTNEDFLYYLNLLNDAFAPYLIQFYLDNDCIEFSIVSPDIDTWEEFGDIFIPNPPSNFNHKLNAFNVYIIQNDFLRSAANSTYAQVRRTLLDFAHEAGHFFSLAHTFQKSSETVLTQTYSNVYECKDRSSLDRKGNKGCETRGDQICDTGADLYAFLGNVQYITPDCKQSSSLTASIADYCGDITTEWNIPVANYMSYYPTCYKEFTKCQMVRMHDYIDRFKQNILMNCQQPSDCNDIIINSAITWSNGVKELCVGQNIIITPSGSLTLDNYKLTKKLSTNSNCPDFSGNWGGIIIQGGFYGPGLPQSPNGPSNQNIYGAFYALNGSIIEFSSKGVEAKDGFGLVDINNSIFRKNNVAFNLFNSLGGLKLINNSLIDATLGIKEKHISVIGSPAKINNSKVLGKSKTKFVGIYSANGRLEIDNSSLINNFNILIEKAIDKPIGAYGQIGYGGGLIVKNSNLINSTTAIKSNAKFINIFKNYIDGKVVTEGLCGGSIQKNKFLGNVEIFDPQSAIQLKNNFFEQTQLHLIANNTYTNAECNTWQSGGSNNLAVDATFSTELKESWGLDESPSGNIWTNNQLDMLANPSVELINYHKFTNPSTIFRYLIGITGDNALGEIGCTYDYRQSLLDITQNSISTCNLDSLNLEGVATINIIDSLILELLNINNLQEELNLEQRISQAKYNLESIYANYLDCIENTNLTESIPLGFYSEYNTKTELINELHADWFSNNFATLAIYNEVTNLEDLDRLITAASILQQYQIDSIDIYNLSYSNLRILLEIASVGFGDYTNILRTWLNTYYNYRFDYQNGSISRTKNKKNTSIIHSKSPNLIIPNPTSDCFSISVQQLNKLEQLYVSVYDFQGIKRMEYTVLQNEQICIHNQLPSGLYYVYIINNTNNVAFFNKLLLAK